MKRIILERILSTTDIASTAENFIPFKNRDRSPGRCSFNRGYVCIHSAGVGGAQAIARGGREKDVRGVRIQVGNRDAGRPTALFKAR